MAFPFLSDEWIDEAQRIRAEYAGRAPGAQVALRANVVVTAVLGEPDRVEGYLDTSGGGLDLGLGSLPDPDVTVTLEHSTARSLLVEGDVQAAMAAFLGGRIRVDGDLTRLLTIQAGAAPVDPVVGEVFTRLREITA